jgi:hypothetical protein
MGAVRDDARETREKRADEECAQTRAKKETGDRREQISSAEAAADIRC